MSERTSSKSSMVLRVAFAILLAVSLGWISLRNVKLDSFLHALSDVHGGVLLCGVLFYGAALYVRGVRMRILSGGLAVISCWQWFRYTMIGMMLDNLLPAHLGEVYRGYLACSRGKVAIGSVLSLLFVERVFDGLVLLAFLSAGLMLIPAENPWVLHLHTVSLVVFGCCLAVMMVLTAWPELWRRLLALLAQRLPASVSEITWYQGADALQALGQLRSMRVLLGSALTSLLHWALEACFYWMLFRAFGIQAQFHWGVLAVAVVSLATALPTLPASVGVYHFALVTSLMLCGVETSTALAVAVLGHLLEQGIENGLGLAFWLQSRRSFPRWGEIKEVLKNSQYQSDKP